MDTRALFSFFVQLIETWRRREADWCALALITARRNDHLLRDAGLTREEAEALLAGDTPQSGCPSGPTRPCSRYTSISSPAMKANIFGPPARRWSR